MEKPIIKGGIRREIKYSRAGSYGNRPLYTIMNIAIVTIILPKWWHLLIKQRDLHPTECEFNLRILKKALGIIGLELVSYNLYEENAYIQVKSFIDGSPVDARITLKSDLRLLRTAIKEFYKEFRPRVGLLRNYTFTDTGKIVYSPLGRRKRLSLS